MSKSGETALGHQHDMRSLEGDKLRSGRWREMLNAKEKPGPGCSRVSLVRLGDYRRESIVLAYILLGPYSVGLCLGLRRTRTSENLENTKERRKQGDPLAVANISSPVEVFRLHPYISIFREVPLSPSFSFPS